MVRLNPNTYTLNPRPQPLNPGNLNHEPHTPNQLDEEVGFRRDLISRNVFIHEFLKANPPTKS